MRTWKWWSVIADWTKDIVSWSVVASLFYWRTFEVAWCVLGAILNGLGVKVVKNALRWKRPDAGGRESGDYGFPSSHSASLAYFGVCALLYPNQLLWWVVGGFVVVASISRVYSNLHTMEQVLGGLLWGWMSAWVWLRVSFDREYGFGHIIKDTIQSTLHTTSLSTSPAFVLFILLPLCIIGALGTGALQGFVRKMKRIAQLKGN